MHMCSAKPPPESNVQQQLTRCHSRYAWMCACMRIILLLFVSQLVLYVCVVNYLEMAVWYTPTISARPGIGCCSNACWALLSVLLLPYPLSCSLFRLPLLQLLLSLPLLPHTRIVRIFICCCSLCSVPPQQLASGNCLLTFGF